MAVVYQGARSLPLRWFVLYKKFKDEIIQSLDNRAFLYIKYHILILTLFFLHARIFLNGWWGKNAALRFPLEFCVSDAFTSVYEQHTRSYASDGNPKRHYVHEDLCRGFTLPHKRRVSEKILRSVRRNRRGCGHNGQTDWEVKRLRLRKSFTCCS